MDRSYVPPTMDVIGSLHELTMQNFNKYTGGSDGYILQPSNTPLGSA